MTGDEQTYLMKVEMREVELLAERHQLYKELERCRATLKSTDELYHRTMQLIHEQAGIRQDGLSAILAWIEDARENLGKRCKRCKSKEVL